MSFLEQLKARQQVDETAAAGQSQIQTGLQATAEQQQASTSAELAEEDQAALLEQAYADYPEGSYLMLRQRKLILAKGDYVKPDEKGVIVADTEEKLHLLRYYDKQNTGLVAKIR